jgi:rhodanese-related sulfurtransferase
MFIITGFVVLFFTTTCLAKEFPLRKKYPQVQTVELEDLKAGYDKGKFIIVDVRSTLEFNTIHPKNAFHIPVSNARFAANLKALSEEHQNKKIAVYCNGVTCVKSFQAVEEAMDKENMKNVYAFDGGIPAWSTTYPSDTLLLGKEITNPKKQLIPKSEFKNHLLDFAMFRQKAAASNAAVIDARDAKQRTQDLPDLQHVKRIPLDKLIKNVIRKGLIKDQQLLIFDQHGKQVLWLMYSLVEHGYTDYYFLKGGATSALKE